MTRVFPTRLILNSCCDMATLVPRQGVGWGLGGCHGQRRDSLEGRYRYSIWIHMDVFRQYLNVNGFKPTEGRCWPGAFHGCGCVGEVGNKSNNNWPWIKFWLPLGCLHVQFREVWSPQILRPGEFGERLSCRAAKHLKYLEVLHFASFQHVFLENLEERLIHETECQLTVSCWCLMQTVWPKFTRLTLPSSRKANDAAPLMPRPGFHQKWPQLPGAEPGKF